MSSPSTSSPWTEIIKPSSGFLHLRLKEAWRYRDLLGLLVKKEIVANYKQTILGPLWFVVQPVLTTFMFVVVFGKIAKISTDAVPMVIFYLAGIICWNFFSDCLSRCATVFRDHAPIFGKVYFPRIIMPVSIIISNLIRFLIQFVLFMLIWVYYLLQPQSVIAPNAFIGFLPLLIFIIGGLGFGIGLIISSMTNKYRDLIFLMSFAVQLAMFASPVIYPLSSVPEKYKWLLWANPMTPVIETFRYGFLGSGSFSWIGLLYSFLFMILIVCLGTLVFNRVEKTFTDTV